MFIDTFKNKTYILKNRNNNYNNNISLDALIRKF